MKVKILMFFIALSLTSIVTNGQHLFTQEISYKERIADRKRAEMKISIYKWTKSDSTYFYSESYNKNGQIISHYDSEFDITRYDYNSFGKRIRAIQMIDNRADTVWEAHYIGDTLLFKVLRDNDSKYIEEIYFDSLEREVRRYELHRKSERVDSIITIYNDTGRVEIQFENGKPILKILETLNSSSSTERHLRFLTNDSTFHYLTWKSTFDKDGNEISRIQEFYDRDSKTEYYTTYTCAEKNFIFFISGFKRQNVALIYVCNFLHCRFLKLQVTDYSYAKSGQLEARHCPPIANVRKRAKAANTTSPPAFRIGVVMPCCSFLKEQYHTQFHCYF